MAQGRVRRVLRGVLRWTLRVIGLVLVLVVVLVLLLLYSNTVLRFAVNQGLGFYNGKIKGHIEVGAVDGRLADAFALRGVRITMADGRPLVTADELTITWSPWAMLHKELGLTAVTLTGADVFLFATEDGGGFGQLAIPGPSKPHEGPGVGPNLPLDIRVGELRLTDIDVYNGSGGPIAEELDLVATAHGAKQTAQVEILEAHAVLAGSELQGLGLAVEWDDPVVVATAHVATNLGKLTLQHARFDAMKLAGEIELAIVGDNEALSHKTEAWLSAVFKKASRPPLVSLSARGSVGELSAEIDAVIPGAAGARLTLAGSLDEGPRLFSTVKVAADLQAMFGVGVGVVQPVVSASVGGDVDWKDIRAEVDVRCEACGVLSGIGLWAAALQDPDGWRTRVALQAAGVAVTGEAALADGRLQSGEFDVTSVDIGVPAAVAGAFAKVPEIAGALDVHGQCKGEPMSCTANLDLQRFAGFGAELGSLGVALSGQPFGPQLAADGFVTLADLKFKGQKVAGAEVSVKVGPPAGWSQAEGGAVGHQAAAGVAKAAGAVAEDNSTVREEVATTVANKASTVAREAGTGIAPLEIGFEAEAWQRRRDSGDRARVVARVRPGPPLEVDVDALSLHARGLVALLMKPTHVRVDGQRIAVRGFDLKAAGGRITADGVFDRGGRSDLDVDVDDVALDKVAVVVPKLRRQLGGKVGFHAHLEGSAHDPTLYVRADARKLWFKATQLGDIDVGVDLDHRDARAIVTVVGPFARRVEVMADTRMLADLKSMKFGLLDAPLHADVDIERVHLSELRPWLEDKTPRGELDVHAAVRGTASSPIAAVRVSGHGLKAEGWKTDGTDFVADFAYDNGHVHGAFEAHHLEAGVRLDVPSVPISLDLVAKKATWRPNDPVAATLVVRDLDLWRQLTPIRPGQDLAGRLDLEVKIAGTGMKPEIAVALDGERLRVRDADLGALHVKAGYADEKATVDVTGRGGMPGDVKIHAMAPVRLAPAVGEVTWLKDQAHEVAARISGLDLSSLRAAGVDAPMKGKVGVTLDASGLLKDPKLAVGVDLRGFAWRERKVGSIALKAKYKGKQIDATVNGLLGDHGKLSARAKIPLSIDLADRKVVWDKHAEHDVRIGMTGLNRSVLLPTGAPIPPDALIELSLEADAKGGIDKFVADLEVHGQMGHTLFGGSPVHITAHVEPKSQRARFTIGKHLISAEIGVRAETKADIPGLIAGTAKAKDIPLTGAMRSSGVDLRFLKAFTPPGLYDPIGKLQAAIDVKGTVGKPDIRGRAELRGGAITILSMQQRIRDIQLMARAEGKHIEVEKLTMRSGSGTIASTAKIDIGADGGVTVGAAADLVKFPLVRPGLPQMQIDSKVKASVASGAKGTKVDVSLAKTEVLVTGYSVRAPKAIPDNVHVRGPVGVIVRPIDVRAAEKEAKAEKAAKDAAEGGGKVDEGGKLALKLALVDPIRFTGPATEMEWSGALAVETGAGKPAVSGHLVADEGRFDLLGNRFKIDTGEVTLPEGELTVDPFLMVVASTTTPVATVKVTIRGRVSRPSLIFSSEPSMPQQQILTLLLTGSADANEADAQKVLAEAATLLILAENPALANFVTRATGLDYVGISFGESTNQPILTVGKHLGKRTYAETSYKHNAPVRSNRVEARIEYELAPQWTLETFFGDAAVGGVDVFWRKLFGLPQAKKATAPAATPRAADSEKAANSL